MKESHNPIGQEGRIADPRPDELAEALDKLIAERLSGPITSPRGGAQGLDGPGGSGLCPEPGEWLELVTEKTDPSERDLLLAHAAGCGVCAARMRLSLRLLAEDATEEEAAAVARHETASHQWQRRLAVKLASTQRRPAKSHWQRRVVWAGAGLAATLTIAAAATWWWLHVNAPERLMAATYSHTRIFDLRMPGADYAEVTPGTHIRGPADGREPVDLLDARTRIEGRLERQPQDPHWLQLEARADVLEEKFDAAIDILDRLLAAGPVTADLLADDATAYYQRGAANGSENDRAVALDYLRRADELTPSDPVVLFNEAVAMEDRGQVMNAVETWNRYLKFERDEKWQGEGRHRLQALEEKLNRLKTHQSRMEQHLATPEAMRSLAADPATLAAVDEEFSSTLLPRLLDSAFPLPVDRSRGSPCGDRCLAARTLLHALAASLERNHQDTWLTQFLPADSSPPSDAFTQAAHALSQSIDAEMLADYYASAQAALEARKLFHALGNAAGEDRAAVERVYGLQRSFQLAPCYREAQVLLGRNPWFAWIRIHAISLAATCDSSAGSASADRSPAALAERLAEDHRYVLLAMRARNISTGTAAESGYPEDVWRIDLVTLRRLYAGDYPALRVYSVIGGLAQVEEMTPRLHLALLLRREASGILSLTQTRGLMGPIRLLYAVDAMRAGAITEAKDQMRLAQEESAIPGEKPIKGALAETEIVMANLSLAHGDAPGAKTFLDDAVRLIGRDDFVHLRAYAEVRGELDLASGHPGDAEATLREAIRKEELLGKGAGSKNIAYARENRELYAALAGVWQAEGRPGTEILALWERYRLRILGESVPACPNEGLDCLEPSLKTELNGLGSDQAIGQVVLLDRLLLYRANSQGVFWTSIPIHKDDLMTVSANLERAVSSPATSQESVDQAARRAGEMFMGGVDAATAAGGRLLLEPDPLLGNLPWPAVEAQGGPAGLRFDLEEVPSLLLPARSGGAMRVGGGPLVVGASLASHDYAPLPEVLKEAESVARFSRNPSLLLAGQATESQVVARLQTAETIHFAGHAGESAGSTRLLLAPDGSTGDRPWLDSSLFRKHPPNAARLVVFSACSSGKREEGWNHGMGDIVDTLASVGVPEVVATRWQIDSGAAVPMMDGFYGGLSKGMSVPQALTAARQSLIRDVRYRHPYYWAAYYASGMGKTDLREVFHDSSK
jgi:tetratricopeptide (TPR) repeat protein